MGKVMPIEEDLAAIGVFEASYDFKEGAFATTRGTNDAEGFAIVNGEVNMVKGRFAFAANEGGLFVIFDDLV